MYVWNLLWLVCSDRRVLTDDTDGLRSQLAQSPNLFCRCASRGCIIVKKLASLDLTWLYLGLFGHKEKGWLESGEGSFMMFNMLVSSGGFPQVGTRDFVFLVSVRMKLSMAGEDKGDICWSQSRVPSDWPHVDMLSVNTRHMFVCLLQRQPHWLHKLFKYAAFKLSGTLI